MWQNLPNCSVSGGVSERNQSLTNGTIHVEADWGDVVRKSDCSVLNPLDVDISFIVVLVFICAFGFPLNFEIVYRIVYDRVLRRQSRYVIQLFSTTSSLFTFFTNVVQICYFFFRRFDQASEHLCHLFVLIFALSYGTFFLNLLASLIDSFVSTNFSNWHKKKVTPRRVVFGLSVLNLALIVAMKWIFIGQGLPVLCGVQVHHAFSLQVPLLSMNICCIFFLVINFTSVWRLLPQASRANPTAHREEMELRPVGSALAVISATVDQESTDQAAAGSSITLKQLELIATKMFLIGIIPFFLFPLPVLIVGISCFNLSHDPPDYCHDLTWLIPYVPTVFSLHAFVSPIMSLWLNKDFAPPCSFRRFSMLCLISFWSFNACFVLITFVVFIFYRIPQSFSH